MKIIEKEKFTILEPEEGMYLATTDKQFVFDGPIYLSFLDISDNYIEVDENEYLSLVERQSNNI